MDAVLGRFGVTLVDRASRGEGFSRSEESSFKADSLSGTWVVPWEQPFFGRFSNPSSWQLTEKGIAAVENYDDRTMNPQTPTERRKAMRASLDWPY